jgi:hypothetical protein
VNPQAYFLSIDIPSRRRPMRVALLLIAVLTFIPWAAWSQGNPLGPEFRVNTYTTYDQGQPSIAADSAGNFVVVWESQLQQPFNRSIFGQRYASSGAPLGAEFRVNASTCCGIHAAPSVAADAAGDFVVIWQFTPLEPGGLRGQRYASSGVPLGGEFTVGNSTYNYNPAVASDPAGNFVVVWDGLFPADGSGRAVFARRYASSGVPLALFRVNTYTTGDQSLASVAADPTGRFVVVWSSNGQDGSGTGIFGQRYDSAGIPLGSEFRVNTYTTSAQGRPSVAADASGNFVVVWQSAAQDGSSDGIFGQRYAGSGAPLGPEFLVNTFTTGYQGRPAAAADASGNFVVAWQGVGSGYESGVFGQRYDSSGNLLGSQFRVNTYTTNDQRQASVAADPSGNFVVVWDSNQDGWGYGVFGQRYLPILPVELMHFRVE